MSTFPRSATLFSGIPLFGLANILSSQLSARPEAQAFLRPPPNSLLSFSLSRVRLPSLLAPASSLDYFQIHNLHTTFQSSSCSRCWLLHPRPVSPRLVSSPSSPSTSIH
ncbi:hypothetical protein C8R45DRAFT_1029418 [Mycena sanguinolenta]|nr:hypothetical protein C8R45DRAFT_1029418 [Mycena sanguinolenta]